MVSHRFAAAVLTAGCLLAGGFAAGPAHADDGDAPAEAAPTAADVKFTESVVALGIPTKPDDDIPAVGHKVCEMMTTGLAGQINPIPAVRGTLRTLQNSGLSKTQAAGLLQASVATYCPEYGRFLPR